MNLEKYYREKYPERVKELESEHPLKKDPWNKMIRDLDIKGEKVLDVGCGTGRHAVNLVKDNEVHGIDISEELLEKAEERGLEVKRHDVSEEFPYEDSSFDTVICIEILEHVFDPLFVVKETNRVLKEGGRFIVSVPDAGCLRKRLMHLFKGKVEKKIVDEHIRFFNRSQIKEALESLEFKIKGMKRFAIDEGMLVNKRFFIVTEKVEEAGKIDYSI